MTGVFLAAPSLVPTMPDAGHWPGLEFTWTGWDGTIWNLAGGRPSGVALKPGVRGLSMPPLQRYTSGSPATAGSRWRGVRAQEREVFWPLGVYQITGSQEWLDYDRHFWRTLDPERPGVWTVTQPNGEARHLTCRFVDDGTHAFDIDPSRMGWTTYGITLVAEDPFWHGQPVNRTWSTTEATSFFGAGAPSFFISSSSVLATARIINPGDVDAWPVWTITGPTESVEVGVGDQIIEVPFGLLEGESLTIDASPTAQTAIDSHGVERTSELGRTEFAPIRPGQSEQLSLNMVGEGTVSATLTPRYYRAW